MKIYVLKTRGSNDQTYHIEETSDEFADDHIDEMAVDVVRML